MVHVKLKTLCYQCWLTTNELHSTGRMHQRWSNLDRRST